MTEHRKKEYNPLYTLLFLVSLAGLFFILIMPNIGPYEPSRRAYVSRARADMRSLATAIEVYSVDYEVYPPWTQSAYRIDWYSSVAAPSFDTRASITTPVSYIQSLPRDPFSPDKANRDTFAYWSCDTGWLLWSRGPDKDFDIYHPDLEATALITSTTQEGTTLTLLDKTAAEAYLLDVTYDPTNGIESDGDVWRWSF
jgi:hypothetical protein